MTTPKIASASLLLIQLMALTAWAASVDELVSELGQHDSRSAKAYEDLLKAPDAQAGLTKCLKNSNPKVRSTCARIMKERREPSSIDSLAGLAADNDRSVRSAAIDALTVYGPNAREGLTKFIDDKEPSIRAAAASALTEIDRGSLKQDVAKLEHDPNDLVRMSVVLEKAEAGDESVRDSARKGIRSKQWGARAKALRALALIGQQQDLIEIDRIAADNNEIPVVSQDARQAGDLIRARLSGSDTPEKIGERMRDPKMSTRRWAASQLLRLRNKGGLDVLRKIAKDPNHPGQGDAEAALQTLDR